MRPLPSMPPVCAQDYSSAALGRGALLQCKQNNMKQSLSPPPPPPASFLTLRPPTTLSTTRALWPGYSNQTHRDRFQSRLALESRRSDLHTYSKDFPSWTSRMEAFTGLVAGRLLSKGRWAYSALRRPKAIEPFVCFSLGFRSKPHPGALGHLEKFPAWKHRIAVARHPPPLSIAPAGLYIPTPKPLLQSYECFPSFSLVFCPIFANLCRFTERRPDFWIYWICRSKNEIL